MKKRILITGGTGRFGSVLKKIKTKHRMFFPKKNALDITNFRSIRKYIKLKKPHIVISHFYDVTLRSGKLKFFKSTVILSDVY